MFVLTTFVTLLAAAATTTTVTTTITVAAIATLLLQVGDEGILSVLLLVCCNMDTVCYLQEKRAENKELSQKVESMEKTIKDMKAKFVYAYH